MDIEKTFDSVDHIFLISVLKKFGFEENFINWIKILLYNEESCVLNGGFTKTYFILKKMLFKVIQFLHNYSISTYQKQFLYKRH